MRPLFFYVGWRGGERTLGSRVSGEKRVPGRLRRERRMTAGTAIHGILDLTLSVRDFGRLFWGCFESARRLALRPALG